MLTPEVMPFWEELEMDRERAKIWARVEQALSQGKVRCFEDYHLLLEDYEEHAGMAEGIQHGGIEAWSNGGMEAILNDKNRWNPAWRH